MIRRHYSVAALALSQLHNTLLAEVPGFDASAIVEGDEATGDVWLTVPDDLDEPAIAAAVAAHDSTPPPLTLAARRARKAKLSARTGIKDGRS